jgi:hypothetical protein
MTTSTFALAVMLLDADPELNAICGGCACRLNALLPEIQTAIRTVARSRIQSPTPLKTFLAGDGIEREIYTQATR